MGDLEEVDLLRGADDVVDLNDCNQALEQRRGVEYVPAEAIEVDVHELFVVQLLEELFLLSIPQLIRIIDHLCDEVLLFLAEIEVDLGDVDAGLDLDFLQILGRLLQVLLFEGDVFDVVFVEEDVLVQRPHHGHLFAQMLLQLLGHRFEGEGRDGA